jgi:hypothetical protein
MVAISKKALKVIAASVAVTGVAILVGVGIGREKQAKLHSTSASEANFLNQVCITHFVASMHLSVLYHLNQLVL